MVLPPAGSDRRGVSLVISRLRAKYERGRKKISSSDVRTKKPRPLSCLACNRDPTRDTRYLRQPGPESGKIKKGSPVARYLHGDGLARPPAREHTTFSTLPCRRRKKTSDDMELVDSSGDDTPILITCHECCFHERAELIVDVRALKVTRKIKGSPEHAVFPKKPVTSVPPHSCPSSFFSFSPSIKCPPSPRPHNGRLTIGFRINSSRRKFRILTGAKKRGRPAEKAEALFFTRSNKCFFSGA